MLDKIKDSKKLGFWAFIIVCAIGGYFLGKWAAVSGIDLTSNLKSAEALSIIAALFVSFIYGLLAVIVALGTASARMGVALEMFEDQEEWEEEKPMMMWSALGTVPLALIPLLMVLAIPFQVIGQTVALLLIAICLVIGGSASLAMWRNMDELWRQASIASGNIAFYIVAFIGIVWSVLAYFDVAITPSPLDWLTVIYSAALVSSVVAVSQRGLMAGAK